MASWKIRYPETRYTSSQMIVLSREYYEDLVDEIPVEIFDDTIRQTRKTCRYFPKVVDIILARDIIASRTIAIRRTALPEQTSEHDLTPEEIEVNKRRLKIIRAVATNRITFNQGLERLEELKTPGVFEGRLFEEAK